MYLCVQTLWTCPRSFTEYTSHLRFKLALILLYLVVIVCSALCLYSEVPECKIRKFWVHLLFYSNLEVLDLQNQKFQFCQTVNVICCIWVKISSTPVQPPSRRHHGLFSCNGNINFVELHIAPSILYSFVYKSCRYRVRYWLSGSVYDSDWFSQVPTVILTDLLGFWLGFRLICLGFDYNSDRQIKKTLLALKIVKI